MGLNSEKRVVTNLAYSLAASGSPRKRKRPQVNRLSPLLSIHSSLQHCIQDAESRRASPKRPRSTQQKDNVPEFFIYHNRRSRLTISIHTQTTSLLAASSTLPAPVPIPKPFSNIATQNSNSTQTTLDSASPIPTKKMTPRAPAGSIKKGSTRTTPDIRDFFLKHAQKSDSSSTARPEEPSPKPPSPKKPKKKRSKAPVEDPIVSSDIIFSLSSCMLM